MFFCARTRIILGFPRVIFSAAFLIFLSVGLAQSLSSPKVSKKIPAGNKNAKPVQTWDGLITYVIKNGADRTLKMPVSRALGFDADEVKTKALRVRADDSPDKLSHTIYATYSNAKDRLEATSVLASKSRKTETDGKVYFDGIFVRFNLNGTPSTIVSSKGPANEVEVVVLKKDDPATIADSKYEKEYFLKTIVFSKLSDK